MFDRLAGKREVWQGRELVGRTTDKTAHAVEISIHEISLVIVGGSTPPTHTPEDVACRTVNTYLISSILFYCLEKRNQGEEGRVSRSID